MPGYVKNRGKRVDGSTRWQARWRPPGDQREASRIEKMFRTKREATAWLATMDADAHRGSYHDPRAGNRTLAAVATEWMDTWHDLAPKTRVGYTAILRRHVLPAFGTAKVGAITTADVQAWVNRLATTRAPNTVRRAMDVLRATLQLAVARRYLLSNPATGVRLPRKAQQRTISIHPLTHAQLDRLANTLPLRDRLPVLLDAYTGLRAGELWALQTRSVDLLHAELRITHAIKEVTTEQTATTPPDHTLLTPSLLLGPTKTHATRRVAIPQFLIPDLEAHLATRPNTPDAFLFTTPNHKPVRHNLWYKRVFQPAASQALPAHPPRFHDLRHTCAALLIDAGAHPLAIKQRLGHKDIQTTMNVYGHLFPSADQALAAALDTARTQATTPSPAAQQLAAPPKPRPAADA